MRFSSVSASCMAGIVGILTISPLNAQTLTDAIGLAKEHLPVRKAQLQTVDASEYLVGAAQSVYLPQVSLGGTATLAEYDNTATRSLGFTDYERSDGFRAELVVRQRLLDFSVSGGVDEARANSKRSAAELVELDRNIKLNVIRAYIDVLRFRALQGQAENNIRDGQGITDIINKQVKAGRSAKVDGHIASTQLAATQAQLSIQQGLLQDAEIRFYRLTGQKPGELFVPQSPALPSTLAAAVAKARDNHPQLAVAQLQVEAAQANLKARRHEDKPTVDVELFGQRGQDIEAVQGDDDAYGIRLVGNWDVYNGGGNRAEAKAAAARLKAATHTADDTKDTIEEGVGRAWAALTASKNQYGYVVAQANADEQVYSSYQKLLKSGRETPLNLLVVQRNRDQSALAKTDLNYRVLLNEYELSLAIGGL